MTRRFDCVVCGSCTADVLVRPVELGSPLGVDQLHRVDPIELSLGGIVSNAGITMSRLGLRVAAFTAVGRDHWGELLLQEYRRERIDVQHLAEFDDQPTSTTLVMIDRRGDRSFVHSQGAPKFLTARDYRDALDLFADSRSMLLGYYPLFPRMLDDVAPLFREIRKTGCQTALDAAGGGGTMEPLDEILPHTDLYCPSLVEASAQTGLSDPMRMIERFRNCGAPGWLGVKLGRRGALLSPQAEEWIEVAAIEPPGPVVDTTGAGDAFFAGLLAGRLDGMPPADAGRLAAAAGAVSVTAIGGSRAGSDMQQLKRLAGVV